MNAQTSESTGRLKRLIASKVNALTTCPAQNLPSTLGHLNQTLEVGRRVTLTAARPFNAEELEQLQTMLTMHRDPVIIRDYLVQVGLEPELRPN